MHIDDEMISTIIEYLIHIEDLSTKAPECEAVCSIHRSACELLDLIDRLKDKS